MPEAKHHEGPVTRLLHELEIRETTPLGSRSYLVPRCVLDVSARSELVDVGNPYAFYRRLLVEVLDETQAPPIPGRLGDDDVIYLTFMRTFASLNGEIGTPLKQIAFLRLLRGLGVTILLSLPTGRIGRANRKGSRGSPFAVANPFEIDDSLLDPLLPGVDAVVQYRAMVGACALAGIRCGSIVPLTTMAIDSELIRRFPQLTYWWRMPVGTPLRASPGTQPAASGSPDVVTEIAPELAARFADPPDPASVRSVRRQGARHWQSIDGLTPASACPDVVADENGTYSWADVAAVRFDGAQAPRLGAPAPAADGTSRSVQLMSLAIAWRAATLGERLFWVDVAARVPAAVLSLACALFEGWDDDSDRLCRLLAASEPASVVEPLLDDVTGAAKSRFATSSRRLEFIAEELFSFDRASRLHDAIVGPWIFCVGPFSRDLPTLSDSISHHLRLLERRRPQAPFLVGLGDHDAIPPAPELVAPVLIISLLLPGSIPLIFSGVEHGAEVFVNREFGFNSTAELRALRDSLDESRLALFNDEPLRWDGVAPNGQFAKLLQRLLSLRRMARREHLTRLSVVETRSAGDLVGYCRSNPRDKDERLAVYFNASANVQHEIALGDGVCVLSSGDRPASSALDRLTIAPVSAVVIARGRVAATVCTADQHARDLHPLR